MDNKLNVCLMNDSFPPVIDGVANAVVNYGRVIKSLGGECTVVTPDYKDAVDDYPFPVVRYPSINTTRLVGYRTGYPFDLPTLKTLKKQNFNIIHCHCPLISMIMARTLREMTGAQIVFTYHTKFDIDIKNAINARLLQETAIRVIVNNISACDEVWVVSKGAGENLRSIGYEGEYFVMENGVDMPKGRADQDKIDEVKAKYGLHQDELVFLFVGRIMWYKGLKLILDALAMLRRSGRNFRMLFVGDGTDRPEVEKYTEGLSLSDNCTFTGAIRDREMIRAFYSAADLFLFPSTFDTNGLVVREAAACGLGSMLIRNSCAAEGVRDGDTGILVSENHENMYQKLTQLCDEPEIMKQIGINAQDKLYISWEESISRAYRQYWNVLDKSRIGESSRKATPVDEIYVKSGEWAEFIGKIYDILHITYDNHNRKDL